MNTLVFKNGESINVDRISEINEFGSSKRSIVTIIIGTPGITMGEVDRAFTKNDISSIIVQDDNGEEIEVIEGYSLDRISKDISGSALSIQVQLAKK